MSLPGLKVLIFAQIALDLTIIFVFAFLLWKLRHFNKSASFDKTLKLFESFLAQADSTALAFKEQLEEKQHLVRRLNDQLDNRITSLNVLLNSIGRRRFASALFMEETFLQVAITIVNWRCALAAEADSPVVFVHPFNSMVPDVVGCCIGDVAFLSARSRLGGF